MVARVPRKVIKDWNKNVARFRHLNDPSRKRTEAEHQAMAAAEAKRERRSKKNV